MVLTIARAPAPALLAVLLGRLGRLARVLAGAHHLALDLFAGQGAHPLHAVVRRHQRVVGGDEHPEAVPSLDFGDGGPFLVQDVERHQRRDEYRQLARGTAHALLLDGAQHPERRRFRRSHEPGAGAVWAHLGVRLHKARTQALARHLQQPERADPSDLNARAAIAHRLLELTLDDAVVATVLHVDEVDDDQAGQIPEPQLASDFLRRLLVRLQRGLLDVALARGAAGIDVDRDQRLGRVNDDRAARAQMHDRAVDLVELAFDLVAVKKRNLAVGVFLHSLGVRGQHGLHEDLGGLVGVLAVDDDLVDVARIDVAQGPLDDVAFLVDQGRGGGLQRQVADLVPLAAQILVVALDLRLAALDARGTQDNAHAVRNLELAQDVLQSLALLRARDLAADAAAARGIGHEHAIAPGER